MTSLDLALLGNGATSALVDAHGRIVWACVPRFDGDPVFCSLLQDPAAVDAPGFFEIDLLDVARTEQQYLPNTPILITRLTDRDGAVIEVTDFMPRFRQLGRVFCPMMLGGRFAARPAGPAFASGYVRPVAWPRVAAHSAGATTSAIRATTWCAIDDGWIDYGHPRRDAVLPRRHAHVDPRSRRIISRHRRRGPLSSLRNDVLLARVGARAQHSVRVAGSGHPIGDHLKLNAFEDTGAIVAAMTTSIPESPNTGGTGTIDSLAA
jgi:hypothetical protein